jgi:vancomycin permeability regulator SanA
VKRLLLWLLLPVAVFLGAAALIAAIGVQDQLAPAAAIVVLGNTVGPDGQPSPRLRARLDCALDAWQQKLAPLLIVTGGTGKEGFDEAAVMARYLVEHGVPAAAVLVDSAGNDTAASAANVARIAREHKLGSVLIATQYFHIARTRLAFERAGLPVSGHIHARYAEWRDVYSLAREVIGYAAYYAGHKEAAPSSPAR